MGPVRLRGDGMNDDIPSDDYYELEEGDRWAEEQWIADFEKRRAEAYADAGVTWGDVLILGAAFVAACGIGAAYGWLAGWSA